MALITIVVPCYNEEQALPLFYQEITRVAQEMAPVDFEFLFVDDGSKDNTLPVLRSLAEADKRVRFLSFSRNFGKEAGMLAGLQHAKGDFVALMDADLQDPPSLLPELYHSAPPAPALPVCATNGSRASPPPARAFHTLRRRWSPA